MAFQDLGQVREIDNELILFRELFKIDGEIYNSLLISQGGRITQHLIEFIAGRQGIIEQGTYDSAFKDFIDKCEFIPSKTKRLVLKFNEYRKKVVYSKEHENELEEIMPAYFKTFIDILEWFDNYCKDKYKDAKFEQIKKTIDYLATEEYVDYKKNRQQVVIDKLDKIMQDTQETKQEVKHHTGQLNDIEDKIDYMSEILINFNNSLAKHREKTLENLKIAKNNDEEEEIYNNFNNEIAEEIKDVIEDCTDKNEFIEEEEKIKDILGKSAWEKLEDESQKFLVTSKITYKHLCGLGDDIDYSGVCLPVTKALEVELKKRFYQGFIDYLGEHYTYSQYHSSFFYDNITVENKLKREKDWTLGGIPHILGSIKKSKNLTPPKKLNNTSKLIEYSKYALFYEDKHDDDEIEEKLRKYGSKINSITDRFRNKAAHTDMIEQKQAKKCLDEVIGKKDAKEHFLKTMLDSFDKEQPKNSN